MSHITYECERIIYYHKYFVARMCGRDPLTVVSPQPPYHDRMESTEDSGPDLPDDW
jgi:hypothetical protein